MVRHHLRIACTIALVLAVLPAAAASAKYSRGLPARPAHLASAASGFDWGAAGVVTVGLIIFAAS
jgi:hypothetical protein